MAEKSAEKILLLALQREIDSQRLYDHIASRVSNPVAKAKFEVLKREEAFHEKTVRGKKGVREVARERRRFEVDKETIA